MSQEQQNLLRQVRPMLITGWKLKKGVIYTCNYSSYVCFKILFD